MRHASFGWWIVTGLLLAGGSAAEEVGAPIVERREGQEPALDRENHVVQGETVYSEFDYVVQKAARLLTPVQIKRKVEVPSGYMLRGYSAKNTERYCVDPDTSWKQLGGAREWLCLIPSSSEEVFVARYIRWVDTLGGSRKDLKQPVPFEWAQETLPAAEASRISTTTMFRGEIVYGQRSRKS